jgi:hypothetical protein
MQGTNAGRVAGEMRRKMKKTELFTTVESNQSLDLAGLLHRPATPIQA